MSSVPRLSIAAKRHLKSTRSTTSIFASTASLGSCHNAAQQARTRGAGRRVERPRLQRYVPVLLLFDQRVSRLTHSITIGTIQLITLQIRDVLPAATVRILHSRFRREQTLLLPLRLLYPRLAAGRARHGLQLEKVCP